MYTRLLSANDDFDSELQHVFCCVLDDCRDSRVFHVGRVFSPSLLNVVLASGLGASNVTRGSQFLTRTHVFPGHGMFFFWIPRKLSCPWYRCCLVDSGGNLLNTWL